MQSKTVFRTAFSFEYIMWIFTRISALTMALMGLIGMIMAFVLNGRMLLDMPTFLRWVFFQNPNHVVTSNIQDITQGWANAYWQIAQMVVAFFAITHGLNGLRLIIEDYIGYTLWRPMMRGFILLMWLFFIVMAVYVILAS